MLDMIKYYKIKFIIFAISITFTLFVFWFYIGCFCTVYHNTQLFLLKDSIIGFGLSMFYPFFLLFIAILLRTAAIKKKCPFLYRISKILS